MPRKRVTSLASTTQLAFGLGGFIFTIVLLDSGGLAQWAQRLDLGPLRSVAAPATQHIDMRLAPLGIDRLRPKLIAALGRAGWSDDPATLAAANEAGFNVWPFSAAPGRAPAPQARPAAILPPVAAQKPSPPAPVPPGAAPTAGVVAAAKPQAAPAPAEAAKMAAAKVGAAPAAAAAVALPVAPAAAPAPIADALPRLTPLPPLGPLPVGRPRQVALVGDSMMAVGLSAVLLRTTAADPKLHMVKAFRSGTGLARPDVFDWLTEYPAMIGSTHPDVVIVALGANDAQGYVDAAGQTLTFGSDAWVASYRARVAAFLSLLKATGRQVLWVGLPPMRSPVYDAHTAEINRITYSVVSASPGAAWWNPTPYIGGADGAFRDLGTVETPTGHRAIAHLRAEDGIHLSDDGAGLLTQVLMPWLEPLPLPPPPAPPPG
jgi:hypothetical protein